MANLRDIEKLRRVVKASHARMLRTAGEVRFIKDRAGDKSEWAWGTPGPAKREITPEYKFDPHKLKPLAASLRSTLAAMGHAMSAYHTFAKVKSATVSPDGALGGKGYIMKIGEMRRQYTNVIEALSALSDTLYDELQAPHWNPAHDEQSPREREQVVQIMDDVEDMKEDPEQWAEEEEGEMDDKPDGYVDPVSGKARKTASRRATATHTVADLAVGQTFRIVNATGEPRSGVVQDSFVVTAPVVGRPGSSLLRIACRGSADGRSRILKLPARTKVEILASLVEGGPDPARVAARARGVIPSATPAQVQYVLALLKRVPVEHPPTEAELQAMDQITISGLISELKDRRGKPTWYGNGQFRGFEPVENK